MTESIDYIIIGHQALPNGGSLLQVNDSLTNTTISVNEAHGETIEARVREVRATWAAIQKEYRERIGAGTV